MLAGISAIVRLPSNTVTLVGFAQSAPGPAILAPVPAALGPTVVDAPAAAHAAEEVNEPEPPWQIVTPVVGGGVETVTVTVVEFTQAAGLVPVTV